MKALFPRVGEVWKAHKRRVETGWYDKYTPADKCGLDIGPDIDPLNQTARRWIYSIDGDATHMANVPDNTFHYIFASHILEHVNDPVTAVRNWYRVLKPQGYLTICVPHRDMYEKRKTLPSKWNGDHKFYWLPDSDEMPVTLSLRRVLSDAAPDAELASFEILSEGFEYVSDDRHSHGEYSIEAILKKP